MSIQVNNNELESTQAYSHDDCPICNSKKVYDDCIFFLVCTADNCSECDAYDKNERRE